MQNESFRPVFIVELKPECVLVNSYASRSTAPFSSKLLHIWKQQMKYFTFWFNSVWRGGKDCSHVETCWGQTDSALDRRNQRGDDAQHHVCWKNQTQHISTNASYQLSGHWVQHELLWIPKYSRVKKLKLGWNWLINRTLIPNTAADLQQNVWKRKESRCCNGPDLTL